MPRDSNGNMTLPAGNPVVSGTAISSAVHNATIADLAAEVQDSLSRSGKGGMLVPFEHSDGTAVAPGVTFASQTGTGLYRGAGPAPAITGLGATVAGVLKQAWEAALITMKTAVKVEGAATFDSTLAVTGVATFTAKPVLTAGIDGLNRASLPAAGQQVGGAISAGGSSTTVADLSAEITITGATGRPVMVTVQAGDASSKNRIYLTADAGGTRTGYVYLYRKVGAGAYAAVACWGFDAAASTTIQLPIGSFLDTPAAGSVSYKLAYKVSNAAAALVNEGMVVAAYEL